MGPLLKDRIKSNALLHKPSNFLLTLSKDLAELFQKQLQALKKRYFLVKLCGKEIYDPSGPNNISLPDNMVRCTYI